MQIDASRLAPAIASLIAEELAELRGIRLLDLEPNSWSGDTVIGGRELPADSIELISLATSCSERFGLQETGAGDYLLRYRRIADWAALAIDGMQDSGSVSFRTSGTTGQARTISHCVADLEMEIESLGRLLADARRIVSLAPAHHIYGFLFTVLLPAHLQIAVERSGTITGLPPHSLKSGDWLVGFPLRWRQLGRLDRRIPAGVSAVTSTSPCPPELILKMQSLGLESMLSIYGATETAGVGYRWGAEGPYTLFDYWRREGELLRRLRTEDDESVLIEPEDVLAFEDQRRFRPVGRKDCVVQVAGRNVRPAHVAERLATHPLVENCSVQLDESGEEPRLSASIVLAAGADAPDAEAALRSWAQDALTSAERPGRWHFSAEVPMTVTGKPRGWSPSP